MSDRDLSTCGDCFQPATTLNTQTGEPLCTACARRYSSREAGAGRAALAVLAHSARIAAYQAGVTEEEIITTIRATLARPHYDAYEDGLEPPQAPEWTLGLFELDTRYVPLIGEDFR